MDNKQEIQKIEKRTAFLDKYVGKMVSRKFLVWLTATIALFFGIVPPQEWLQVCLIYIGSEAIIDMVSSYVRSRYHGVE